MSFEATIGALSLTISARGEVEARISAAGPPAPQLGLFLDGILHQVSAMVRLGASSQYQFSLPTSRLFEALDLKRLPEAESLLGAPLLLADYYGLALVARWEASRIRGTITASALLAPAISIAWVAGNDVMANGIAQAVASQTNCWQFDLSPDELPRPEHNRSLQPRLGGLTLRAPVLPWSAAGLGFWGCLDTANPGQVTGWAINLAAPDTPVALEILVNMRPVATLHTGEFRPDLVGVAGCAGHAGFTAALPDDVDKTQRIAIHVRLAGTRINLAGSPSIIDPVPGLNGYFDAIHGMSARGWAMNHAQPDEPLTIEIVAANGVVVGTGVANLFRGDLLEARLNDGHCAFMIDISPHFENLLGQDVYARIAGTQMILAGSPVKVSINPNIRRFLRRRRDLPAGVLPRLKRALNHRAGADGISFIMPIYNTPRLWLIEALESVRSQFCDAWELICVDDASTAPHIADILRDYAARDKRIRVLRSPENVGIARAINFGLRVVKYDYTAFIDHDDVIEPDAAWQMLRAARQTGAELLYSDEAHTAENIDSINEFRLRPAFSYDYYLSHPYFVHMICVRTDVARRIGGWDEKMPISADVDFVLRMIEAANMVTHVPAVLYRWRTHSGSTGHAKQEDVMAATIGALQRHLDRCQRGAVAKAGVFFNQFQIDWPKSDGRILIVIPTKNKGDLLRVAVDSIEQTSIGENYKIVVIDHASDAPESKIILAELALRHTIMPYKGKFNFSRMNNQAVRAHGADCEFVLFLNNDVEATQPGWLDRLRRLAHRPDVGAVGALLMYADQTVQHAGVILGFNDSAEHALKFQPVFLNKEGRRNLGYNCALSSTRDYSAVTAACLMMRKDVFQAVGGFDEKFAIGFNDTDLCLRIRAAGYKILYDGSTLLYHYESATRSETKQVFHPADTKLMITRWQKQLAAGDAFYNPNLSMKLQDHVLRDDGACRVMHPPRPTRLPQTTLRGTNQL